MAKQGSIDVHPDRAKIEGLLLAGVQLKQIAQEVPGANVFALSRYKKKFFHSQPETDGDPREEVRKWLSRADDQYLMAVANADQRAAVQSLVAGLRAVESRFKVEERQEAETAKKAESQGVPPISIAQLDQLVRVHNRMETDETRLIESVGRYLDLWRSRFEFDIAVSAGHAPTARPMYL